MTTAGIAPRAARLADLPAPPLLALLELVPSKPEGLACLQIRPGPSEGLVEVEVAGPSVMGRLVLEGEAARPVCLPRAALVLLKRRHPDAERLVIDALEDPRHIGLRTFSACSTVAISTPEAAALPLLPLVTLAPDAPPPAAGAALPLLLDPALLARALTVLHRLGSWPVRIHLLADPLVGVALEPGAHSDLAGGLQLARCVLLEAG